MSLRDKIWRKPTKEDVQAFFDRWAERQDAGKALHDLIRMDERSRMFTPILTNGPPINYPLCRLDDYREMFDLMDDLNRRDDFLGVERD